MQTSPSSVSPTYDASIYKSSRSTSISTTTCSNFDDQYTINCICGRKMVLTQNPSHKYPPNAVLHCQQSSQCNQQITVQHDWFYCCKSKTSYHNTKDGTFKICYSCSISSNAKKQRMNKNHELIIEQLKNGHHGKVLITEKTKEYLLTSHSNDKTFKLLQKAYIDQEDKKNIKTKVIKEGFMMKRGNVWNKSFQKRYFKLLKNKQMFYYTNYENGVASDERGIVDLKNVNDIIKKQKNGLEIHTPSREWKFQCSSNEERNEWYQIMHALCGKNDCCLIINSDKTEILKYDI